MIHDFSRCLTMLALGLLLMTCAGCASTVPSRFYQLNSLKTGDALTVAGAHEQAVILAIGPLRIPDYLDRPQIVTRSGRSELRLAEFDRWAGSLEKDIIRVLAEDVSALLPADRFFVIHWVSASQSAASSLYRVEVNIIRFEGAPGESVMLNAQWAVFHREKGMLLNRESTIREEVRGAGYDALVSALSSALGGLSREIATAVMPLR